LSEEHEDDINHEGHEGHEGKLGTKALLSRFRTMPSVFVVHHSYDVGDRDEVKLIGVYASRSNADGAIARLVKQPGFREYPSGFSIDEYEIGKDHWTAGFASLVTIMVPIVDEGVDVWRPVHAEIVPEGRYRIVTENSCPEDERWAFRTGQLVLCEERVLEGERRLVAVSLADNGA
jgi:hypothetical protein